MLIFSLWETISDKLLKGDGLDTQNQQKQFEQGLVLIFANFFGIFDDFYVS